MEAEASGSETEIFLDHLAGNFKRERRYPVLKLHQFHDDVRGDDIRSGAQELPELDEGGPEFVQHLPYVPAALSWRRRTLPLPPAGSQTEQPVPLEEIPETVSDRDLGDLAHPLEVADAR